MKFYTDPNYFYDLWVKDQNKLLEKKKKKVCVCVCVLTYFVWSRGLGENLAATHIHHPRVRSAGGVRERNHSPRNK